MLILALDTSGDVCSLCLAEGERPRLVFHCQHELRLSERLPSIIDFSLRDARLRLADVEAFAVGLGPGSFTGVRVGVTMARTFAQVLGRPLIGVSSLDALAQPYYHLPNTGIIAIAPSRRSEVIAAYYHSGGGVGGGGSVEPLADPEVVPTLEVVSRAAGLLPGGGTPLLLLCGEARALPPESGDAVPCPASVSAASIALLAASRLARGESDDPLTLAPLYVAPSPVGQ